jgi:hypothetical protein
MRHAEIRPQRKTCYYVCFKVSGHELVKDLYISAPNGPGKIAEKDRVFRR